MKSIRNYNQQGGIQLLVIVVSVIVLLVILGHFFWKNVLAPKESSVESTAVKHEKKGTTKPPIEDTNVEHLVINEWSVKIKMQDAEKVAYTYTKQEETPGHMADIGKVEGSIGMSVKNEFLDDNNCQGASLVMYRFGTYDKNSGWAVKEIKGKYYVITGSPYICDGGSNTADNILNSRVLSDFKLENLSSL